MPYEPIRCPTCASSKVIAAENERYYCASCDGWFVPVVASDAAKQSFRCDTCEKEFADTHVKIWKGKRVCITCFQVLSNTKSAHTGRKEPTVSKPVGMALDELAIEKANVRDTDVSPGSGWHYQAGSHRHEGPVSFGELLRLESEGAIESNTLVRRSDGSSWMGSWTTWAQVKKQTYGLSPAASHDSVSEWWLVLAPIGIMLLALLMAGC